METVKYEIGSRYSNSEDKKTSQFRVVCYLKDFVLMVKHVLTWRNLSTASLWRADYIYEKDFDFVIGLHSEWKNE